MEIHLIETKYDWETQSIAEFLNEGNIPSGWFDFFNSETIREILGKVSNELEKKKDCKIFYPDLNQVFRAFYITPLENVKAVIIGMDPYHNGNAVGLCFSVKSGKSINPSLRSIYKELKMEGFNPKENGNLIHWANQGVLMLNMSLSVEKGKAGSHSKIWKKFSEEVVKYLDKNRGEDIHWILMGNDACKIKNLINKGVVHTTVHPMPLAEYKSSKIAEAFWGSGVFSRVKSIKW